MPKSQSPASEGFDRVLENKYFVVEGYDKVVVQPLVGVSRAVLWKGMDAGLIDGLFVNGSAQLARGIGWLGARVQSGQVGTYAWVLIIGVVAIVLLIVVIIATRSKKSGAPNLDPAAAQQ